MQSYHLLISLFSNSPMMKSLNQHFVDDICIFENIRDFFARYVT